MSPAVVREARQKLQTLLAERFQLVARRDKKQMPVFELVSGKNGPKLKAVEAGAPDGPSGIRSGGCGRGLIAECGEAGSR